MALTIADADAAAKTLRAQPPAIASIFAACGKVKSTTQVRSFPACRPSLSSIPRREGGERHPRADAGLSDQDGEIAERAMLPHDLPPTRKRSRRRLWPATRSEEARTRARLRAAGI
jgi:hypothetical protein